MARHRSHSVAFKRQVAGEFIAGETLHALAKRHDISRQLILIWVGKFEDSDHGSLIYPDLAKDVVPDRPNQLWVADLTYVAIPGGFVYLAAILDPWSRKVVGYAISRSMDARIAVAALKAALRNREPPKGCIHHSDRGSQPGLNWSSQRQPDPILAARRGLLQVFSTPGSCVACR